MPMGIRAAAASLGFPPLGWGNARGVPAAIRTPQKPWRVQYHEDCGNILISLSLNLDEGEIFIAFTDKTAFFSGREEEAD